MLSKGRFDGPKRHHPGAQTETTRVGGVHIGHCTFHKAYLLNIYQANRRMGAQAGTVLPALAVAFAVAVAGGGALRRARRRAKSNGQGSQRRQVIIELSKMGIGHSVPRSPTPACRAACTVLYIYTVRCNFCGPSAYAAPHCCARASCVAAAFLIHPYFDFWALVGAGCACHCSAG